MKNDIISIIARYNNLDEKSKISAMETLTKDPESIIFAYKSFDAALVRGAIDKSISLSTLICALIKKKAQKESLEAYLNANSNSSLIKALSSSSPKLRKNAARIMGALKDKKYASMLALTLEKETQLIIRPFIISALGSIGEENSIKILRALYDSKNKVTTDKHELEELNALKDALLKNETIPPLTFLGLKSKREIVLRTMPGFAFELKDQLKELGEDAKTTSQNDQDVILFSDDIQKLYSLRTFSDMYFIVGRKIPFTGKAVLSVLEKFDIVSFLKETHGNDLEKMYYRIEIPGTKITQKQRSEYIHDITSNINKLPLLQDNPYNYQFEILIEPFSRSCDVYINLKTIKDDRFNYRLNTLPASINPYIAAIVAQYIKKYSSKDAKVLDPFCGTGTILVERAKAAPYDSLYGVDIKQNAIDFATENAKAADILINYIHSDIQKFVSNVTFNEIISNMPFGNRVGNHKANIQIYEGFFGNINHYLSKNAFLALYTMEGTLLESVADKNGFNIIEKHKMYAGGLRPTLYILKQK